MGIKIGVYEAIIFMLVYGGLFMFTLRTISSKNKTLAYIKSGFLMILYGFISFVLWSMYKGEEYHINTHSGYAPISFTSEAIQMIVGFSIFNIILLLVGIQLRKRHSVNA